MATTELMPHPKQQYFDTSGNPLNGGFIYTFEAGTSTPKNVYTDSAGLVPHQNPIELNARGEPPSAMYFSGAYKIEVRDSRGSLIYTVDNYVARSAKLVDDLAASTGAGLVGFSQAGSYSSGSLGAKLKTIISVKDAPYSAKGDGSTDDTAAIQAAINAVSGNTGVIYFPTGNYKVTQTLTIPDYVSFIGDGINSSVITIAANAVAVRLKQYSRLCGFKIAKTGTHSANGVDVGSDTVDGGRALIESVWVDGMGNDGIQVRNGNLGTLRDVVCTNNGRDGINFTTETADNNAWTLEGFIDLRGNTRDGLHFDMGSSASDPYAPKCNFVSSVTVQSNGRYGVYSGTRSNVIEVYAESNTSKDIYLDTYAYGNKIIAVQQAGITDNGAGNLIETHSLAATYERGFDSKVRFSGGAGKGWRISNDDGSAGYLDFSKTAANTWEFVGGGTSASQTIKFRNSAAPTAFMTTQFGGHTQPDTDNFFNLGAASYRWSTVYAATGAINTSDGREKQQVRNLSDQEKAAAVRLKSLIRAFKFNDAVEKKGDGARIHFGVIAQEVKAAFEAEGLVAEKYAVLCYDEWEAQPEITGPVLDENGNETGEMQVIQPALPAGNRYGVRYEELLAFIVAVM